MSWNFTSFYGDPDLLNRHFSWELLKRLSGAGSGAWLCAGDFNETLFDYEKQGGPPRSFSHMEAFQESGYLQFYRLWFSRDPFRWWNKQGWGSMCLERLDRALCNLLWRTRFSAVRVFHLE